ncbi:hypothetical protein DFH27DRAFT_111093 [Peziza echinospora]|nr:hypothetical protein DFH27DRAFT_111093 [Peziza echinospora]
MSPRRSSRARPSSTALAHHSSSSSSASSTRASSSRTHRHPEDSTDHEVLFRDEAVSSLDSRRRNSVIDTNDIDEADNDIDETGSQDDEITRCICGNLEYQGEESDQADVSEGLFIQCDTCHVWQHGFCVGITDTTLLAKLRYDCEKCRPELHKLIIKPYGPKTSIYLPLHGEVSPTESINQQKSEMSTKRRSTNNSRGAAYDHDAVLQRVLEESKSETNKATSSRGGTRGRKRGSSEGSEEQKEYKRARTSDSDTPTTGTIDSGDEKQEKVSNTNKKGRNGTSRSNSGTTTVSSKKTSTRSKAAEKPKESQKDDSEHSDEFPVRNHGRTTTKVITTTITTTTTPVEEIQTPVVAEVVVPDTPQQSKRSARTTNNHGRRKGNKNSYRQSEDPHDVNASPAMARDASQNGVEKAVVPTTKEDAPTPNTAIEKSSKPRLPQPKTSMADMNKRVNSIMEFIQRTQVEMALERQRSSVFKPTASSPRPSKATPVITSKDVTMTDAPSTNNVPQITVNGGNQSSDASVTYTNSKVNGADVSSMHSTEIMDVLTRKLVHWQQTFGKLERV